jgi:hypothetical protein
MPGTIGSNSGDVAEADTVELKRATQVFRFDEARLDSAICGRIWRSQSEPVESFTSVAAAHWEMAVIRQYGRTSVFVRGPETRASLAAVPPDAEFFGIEFKLGTCMPDFPVAPLVDGALLVPNAGSRTFWINGSAWEIPTFDNADVFLRRLAQKHLVVCDPIVEAALGANPPDLSERSLRRRIRRTTGLTRSAIRQITRAEEAVALLESGAAILDVVARAGYADQAHLTRSLRRFVGQTPAQIRRQAHGRFT